MLLESPTSLGLLVFVVLPIGVLLITKVFKL